MRIPFLPRPKKVKSLKESGFGLVSTVGSSFTTSSDKKKKIPEDPRKPFSKYIISYNGIPMISSAILKTVDFVVSPGFFTDSKSKRAKRRVDEFMEKMNFDIFLRRVTKDMLLFGDSFVEIVGKSKSIKELKPLNPEFMRVMRDETGEVTGYFQDLRGAKKDKNHPWKPEQIAHFIYNQVGDKAYGTSIIEPLEKIISIKVNMENSMDTILKRKSNAPYHAKLGDTPGGFPATQTDIDSFTNDLQNLTGKTNWVTTDLCDIEAIGVKGKIIDIEPYTEHIDNQMVYGLQVPFVLLGRADIPEGMASVQLEAMDRRAKSIQTLISNQIEEKIFKKITSGSNLTNKVFLKWGEPSKVSENVELTTFTTMMGSNYSPAMKAEIEQLVAKILNVEVDSKKEDFEEEGGPFQNFKNDKKGRPEDGGILRNPKRRKEINISGAK